MNPTDNPNLSRNPRTQLRPGNASSGQRRAVVDMPNLRRGPESTVRHSAEGGRRLVVGRDIVLAGQISKCDFLIVEGSVEGMRYDGQSIEVTETGAFSGNIEVDQADISGSFEGSITVRGRLTVRPTGRVSGTIRYNEIEVSAGGQLIGEMSVLSVQATHAVNGVMVPPPAVEGSVADDGMFSSASERLVGE